VVGINDTERRRNVITLVNVWSALVHAAKKSFFPGCNNSVVILDRWLLTAGSASSSTISTTEEYDLRSAVSSKLIDNTQRTGRLSSTVDQRLSSRGRVLRSCPTHDKSMWASGSSKMSQSEVQFHYSRFTPLQSAIAFPAPYAVVFLSFIFFPSRPSPTRTC